jgi:uncharacterized protein YgiM (DUF1202 family)
MVLLGSLLLIACGGVNTADEQRGPSRASVQGGGYEEEEDTGDVEEEEPSVTDDAGASTPPVDAAPPVPDGSFAAGTDLQTTADLNLRTGEGTEFDIITTIPQGSIVKVQTTSGASGWVHVDYAGTVGYASKMFLQVP